MKKKFLAVIVSICCLMFLAGTSMAAEDITDPILKKLVEKGVLTKEEATSITEEMKVKQRQKRRRPRRRSEVGRQFQDAP